MKHAMIALAALLLIPLALAQDQPPDPNLEPLKLTLPEPVFSSTPLIYTSPNFEEPDFKPRAPFLAPKGAANAAKGKPVTASAEPNAGKLEQLTDGEIGATEPFVIELPAGKQWIQVDLGAPHTLHALLLWHFYAADRVYYDIVVQASDDPDFQQGVTTLYNNDLDNSLGLGVGPDKEYVDNYNGRLIDAKNTKARYIRLYSKGNTSDSTNHYIELEAYATPAQ